MTEASRNLGAPESQRPEAPEEPKIPETPEPPETPTAPQTTNALNSPRLESPDRPEQAAGTDRAWRRRRRPDRRAGPGRRRDPPPPAPAPNPPSIAPQPSGYAPDGTAGRAAALPLSTVQLLDSPFRQNQARNTTYLLFLDPERMLRSFRLNYGQSSTAEPLGGWEQPDSQIRGHMTGHLLSGLALTYANTNDGPPEPAAATWSASWPRSRPGPPRPGSTPATCPRSPRSTSTGWSRASRSGRRTT